MSHAVERAAVVAAARQTVALGLTHGTSGNVSVRIDGGMLITPSGIDYDRLDGRDIVPLALDGSPHGPTGRAPSSEWRMHAAVYRERPDVAAIVHGHSPATAALSCLDRDIPAFHYMIAVAGGESIRCARYATFGTGELAAAAVVALRDRWACLLAHHGFLSLGVDLEQALAVGVETEFLADLYLRLLPLGEPRVLDPDDMAAVRARFSGYGQRAST